MSKIDYTARIDSAELKDGSIRIMFISNPSLPERVAGVNIEGDESLFEFIIKAKSKGSFIRIRRDRSDEPREAFVLCEVVNNYPKN